MIGAQTSSMMICQSSGGMLRSAQKLTISAYALAVNYQAECSILPLDRGLSLNHLVIMTTMKLMPNVKIVGMQNNRQINQSL